MTSASVGHHTTINELLAAATKLDNLADEMERTGHQIGGAAGAASSLMPGFSMGVEAVAACGNMHKCIGDTVRDLRTQARQLRSAAAEYTEMDRRARAEVSMEPGGR